MPAWSTEAIIAFVTLLATCFPLTAVIWCLTRRRQPSLGSPEDRANEEGGAAPNPDRQRQEQPPQIYVVARSNSALDARMVVFYA
ncbi:hypothetical protein BS50DRAFT_640856 [Corynespora cassiicola Philippines]|uniref:Uncharacterized protein n=1 Tax=Corynespora cassiicola Philippines TaxID=1448308 RepID=A0A2T2N2N5_CORCC|nr:hypothetical protein BS50DRAFT_640856 [Corynespora cassiicola Philippines]